jgi:hypothetical protein
VRPDEWTVERGAWRLGLEGWRVGGLEVELGGGGYIGFTEFARFCFSLIRLTSFHGIGKQQWNNRTK